MASDCGKKHTAFWITEILEFQSHEEKKEEFVETVVGSPNINLQGVISFCFDMKKQYATLPEIGSAGSFRRMFKKILAELDPVHNFANAFLEESFLSDL